MQLIETLPARQYFAASAIDTTWHYDPATLTAAAGQHVNISEVVPAAGGQYVMLGATDKGAKVLVRLNENGSVDSKFGRQSIVDVGYSGQVRLVADNLGYTYLYTAQTVFRFRSNGMRDTSFGTRGRVNFDLTSAGVLDFNPDNVGGVNVLTRRSDIVTLVHISAVGGHSIVWSAEFPDHGNATISPSAEPYFGNLVAIKGGGYVIVTSRVFFGQDNAVDNPFNETGGDADVFFLSGKGVIAKHFKFDTGQLATRATVNADGSSVVFVYGARQLKIVRGRAIRRTNVSETLPANLPNGRSLTLDVQPGPNSDLSRRTVTAHLFDSTGADARSFGLNGFPLTDRIDRSFSGLYVKAVRPDDALVFTPHNSSKLMLINGQAFYEQETQLIRLWTTDGVSPTLIAATSKQPHALSVSFRYRAKGGVQSASIGSGDVRLITADGKKVSMHLKSKFTNSDGSVEARFAAGDLVAGTYQIRTVAGSVFSDRGYGVSEEAFGTVTI